MPVFASPYIKFSINASGEYALEFANSDETRPRTITSLLAIQGAMQQIHVMVDNHINGILLGIVEFRKRKEAVLEELSGKERGH